MPVDLWEKVSIHIYINTFISILNNIYNTNNTIISILNTIINTIISRLK